jgi:hypothetical protein
MLAALEHEWHGDRAVKAAMWIAGCAAAAMAGSSVSAQTCEPPKHSNEATIFGKRGLALAFARGPAAANDRRGAVRFGVEVTALPRISNEDATPTTCRPGKGPENVNAVPAFGRIRASVRLPGRLTLEAGWVPPVRLKGTESNLLGVAVSHDHLLTTSWLFVARAHALIGDVKGPFTCSEDDVRDASSECLNGTVSNDRFEPNVFGVDASLEWARAGVPFSAYGGAGYSRLAPRFQVGFRDAAGDLDSTRVEVDLQRLALFGGLTRALRGRWRASGELYATLDDGATIRFVLDAIVRSGRGS